MADIENREDILRRDGLLVGIVGVAALNGLPQSAYFLPGLLLMEPFVKVTFFTSSPAIVNYFTALVLATLTIMLGGIPAAISERIRGLKESDATSYYIWLGGVMLLALPTLFNLAKRSA
jgi:hypothetical protein